MRNPGFVLIWASAGSFGRRLHNITHHRAHNMSPKPLNVGLVGGGKGAFIVQPHQKAIHFDGTRRVTAGALFPDPDVALQEAANWPYPIKGYGSYTEMIDAQDLLQKEERLDYILIVTPNHVHFDPAM